MDKARAKGKAIGRPVVVDRVDADLVVRLRNEGKSWREIAEAHPRIKSVKGKWIKPSVGSIRRVFALALLNRLRYMD
jgi:DNA invertase Pin-like site-specific DNA recombinase